MDLVKIGENIRIARTIRGFSQEGVAHSIGKSQNWMQKVEKGEIDLSISSVNSLSKSLEVQPGLCIRKLKRRMKEFRSLEKMLQKVPSITLSC